VDEGIKERETALKAFGHHVPRRLLVRSLVLSDDVKEVEMELFR